MRKTGDLRHGLIMGGLTLVLALALFGNIFSMTGFVSHAESQGKITAQSVNIRKEPSTTSEVVGSTEINKVVSIVSQEKGADGNTWYKVYVDATTMGYIRSDLLTITDGSTPPTVSSSGGNSSGGNSSGGNSSGGNTATPTEPPANTEPPAEVTEVNPVSGTITGDAVKIYDNVSTDAQSLAEMANSTALTVVGYAADSAGTTWYKVNFISNESQIEGFVQAPYVHLSGELTPLSQNSDPGNTPTPTEPPKEQKQYDTIYANGTWLLYNTDNPNDGYPVEKLLENNKKGADLYDQSQKTVKNQKVIIIILVFLLVAAVAGIAFLVFKIRDMMDSAYFNEVENETLRRRNAGQNQGSSQRVMHKVGTERQPGSRPSGSRQPGANPEQKQAGVSQGQRPAGSAQGQRPSGSPQGQRPAGSSQGSRPSGAAQGQRPSGTVQGSRPSGAAQGQRPSGAVQGQRPSGSPQGQRPSGTVQGSRPSGAAQGQRPSGTPQGARPVQNGGQKAQPKNFMADDEEFEFEFLNYDGDDDQ